MITRNTEIDDVEYQRSEIISDLWKDLADNEKSGEFIIHDRCIYEIYDPLTGEPYFIVPTVCGCFNVKPLSMRELARAYERIQPKSKTIVLDSLAEAMDALAGVKQCFQAMYEKEEEIETNGTTLEPRDIRDKHTYTNWAPTKRQRSAIKGRKNNPFR